MNMAKISSKLANIFSTEKKSSASAQAQTAAAELEASQEKARKELLKLSKTARLGFPHKPTCMAYDPVQNLLAIGTRHGHVKFYGDESIEYTISHTSSPSNCSQSFGTVPSASSLNNVSNNNNNSNNVSSGTATAGNSCSPISSSRSPLAALNAVQFMCFVINEGALITCCDDSTISFWNLRQKQPGIIFSRKLVNEKATAMYLPFQSNWLFIGTEKGNIYLLNVYNNFSQSGYDIKWNNVIELSQKNKPGKVVHLSEHPLDSSKILIGYDSGLLVLWSLKLKRAESHFYGTSELMSSASWFFDGKQFLSSHNNGSLIVWNVKSESSTKKPAQILHPHMSESDLIPRYNMVKKCAWESTKSGDSLLIFSDGLPSSSSSNSDCCCMKDAITIIKNNKIKTIVEMKEKVIDFLVIQSSPWTSDNPTDPIGLIVLLENSLCVLDLKSEGYPQFKHHHVTNLHESPVTTTFYLADPNRSLFKNLLASRENYLKEQKLLQQQQWASLGQQKQSLANNVTASKQVFSPLSYPICGGLKCSKANSFSYKELLVTGHEDGSVKFWDTSGLNLILMHKFKTQKLFDKRKFDANNSTSIIEIDYPYKITALCVVGNYLAVAAQGGHVTLYRFHSKEPTESGLADIPLFEIPIEYGDSKSQNEPCSQITANLPSDLINKKELKCFLRTKIGFRRQQGFQPELVCLLYWSQRPPVITCINIYAKSNVILFGTDESIVGMDYANRTLLINLSIVDFYGAQDPFHRIAFTHHNRSPKKTTKSELSDENFNYINESSAALSASSVQKQQTIDQTNRETGGNSRSSSCSSLENLSQSEGVACICINDHAPTVLTNAKSEFQQQIVQIWLGTSYGSVLLLNLTSQQNNASMKEKDSISPLNDSQPPSQKSIAPSGTTHSLKGQVVDISFIDANGILLQQNAETSHEINKSSIKNDDLDLDIDDFNFLNANSIISNSIAENFYSSSSTNINESKDSSSAGPDIIDSPFQSSAPSNSFLINSFANNLAATAQSSTNVLTQSFDETKPSKTTKKSLMATKSAKLDLSTTQDPSAFTSTSSSEKSLFAVLTSENQIKVIGLPSQTCIHKYSISEGSVARASVTVVNLLSYLTCYLTNGNFLVFNLPNPTLKANLCLNSQSFTHYKEKEMMDRALRTFAFGGHGHALYMCSPSELQKVYLSVNNSQTSATNLADMLSEIFDPKISTPQAPKPNLFKSLFDRVTPFDREELFGESSGKPSTSIIKNVDNEAIKAKKELSELQKLALERGEKLSALQMKTEEMTLQASEFAKNAHALANKYKSRKFF